VLVDYVDPKEWLQLHVTGGPIRTTQALAQIWFVIATFGLRVRQDHSTSAVQVGTLAFGSRVLIDEAETFNQDSYTWGRIRGGMYNGDFLAMGKSDQSETYLSRNPPSL
jgi:hypothetical protein